MTTAMSSAAKRHEGQPAEPPVSLLRMAVGTEVLAVPIEDVREILQVAKLTPLPRTPGFVRGVMNLRGSVVPVIDLSVRLGYQPTELGRRSCIVVVEYTAMADEGSSETGAIGALGLLVDAVFEVFDRASHEIEPPPSMGTAIAPGFLRGVTRAGGQLISVLALHQVLSAGDLASAIAAWQPH